MTEQATNYDDVKQYRLDPEREEELRRTGGECTFIWANKSGHPLGVTTAYVPVGEKIWMTATRERVRIKAIARDGRSSVSTIEVKQGLRPGDRVILSDMSSYDGQDRIKLR